MDLAKASPHAPYDVPCLGVRNRQGDGDLLLGGLGRERTDSGSGGLRSCRLGSGRGLRLLRFATSSARAARGGRGLQGGNRRGGGLDSRSVRRAFATSKREERLETIW